jgi:hypothetical protein
MYSLHSNPTTTSDEQRRAARVADAVVAGYIHSLSRRDRAVNSAAAPHVRPGTAGDRSRNRPSGAGRRRTPLRSREHHGRRPVRHGSPAASSVYDA